MNLDKLTAAKIKRDLQSGEYSVVELVEAYLKRIERLDSELNAFITVCGEQALKRAVWADQQIAKDKDAFDEYPLLGVPYTAKDLFCTRGIKTTAGSKLLEDFVPEYDATVVAKLRKAGAVLLGKTNCDAWGHGASGENSDFGPGKNPWDLERVPGGSSSGSAVSVSACLAAFSTGTDTGGSVRNPASFCNLTALKPTYGRVSRYGVVSFASSLDCMGHLARTVEDCEMILAVTEGNDPYDATNYGTPDRFVMPKEIRVGLPKEYFGAGVNSEVAKIVKGAAQTYKSLGCQVQEVSLPKTEYGVATYYILAPSEVSSNLARYDGIRYGKDRGNFGDEAKRRIMLGTYTLSAGYYDAYYDKAQKVRRLIMEDFTRVFKEVDVLLAPTTPGPAFKLGEKADDPLSLYMEDALTIPASLAGLPSLALPAGFSKKGLPVGMQIIGPPWRENLLFKLGKLFQQETDFHLKVARL